MAVKLAMEVPIIYEDNADTWVFIDPPPQQPEQDDISYSRYVERCRAPKLMRSSTLFALNSPFFEKALGPSAQHRTLRRRGLVGKLPFGIKYVLDLTPPSEGEEAVYLTSELCCSEGVRKWAIAGKLWKISKTLIAGEDEYSSFNRQESDAAAQAIKQEIQASDQDEAEKQHQFAQLEESFMPLPLQYTPLRHRSAIERVLLAISGRDPILNSAPKVWTACAVAAYFEITQSPFKDYVVRWLRASPNHYFLEVLPEVSIRIADGFQCHDLCRDTFAILVGEEALGSLCRLRPGVSALTTVHGRRKEDLPEIYQTRVEYASKALIERVSDVFGTLIGLQWLTELPEMIKLLSATTPATKDIIQSLKTLLEQYIRGAIGRSLCANYPPQAGEGKTYAETNSLFPMKDKTRIWNDLLPRERLLTRSFWESFIYQELFSGPSNMHIAGARLDSAPLIIPSSGQSQLLQDGIIKKVSLADLESLAAKFQHLCRPEKYALSDYITSAAGSSSKTNIPASYPRSQHDECSQSSMSSGLTKGEALEKDTDLLLPEAQQWDAGLRNVSFDWNGSTNAQSALAIRTLVNERPLTQEEREKVCMFMKTWVPLTDYDINEALKLPYEWYETKERSGIHTGIYALTQQKLDNLDPWVRRWLDEYEHKYDVGEVRYESWNPDFSLARLFGQADEYLRDVARRVLAPTDSAFRSETHPLSMSDILVSLEDSEFKYLPLWAGGCDDGSGGVYDDDVPISDSGFSHPGPNIHLGSGSSAASSEFDFIRGTSSHNTSTIMNKGTSTSTGSTEDWFEDAEKVRAPSTVGDSEYDFGSVAPSEVGAATQGIARLDVGQRAPKSEKARGKMPVRENSIEDAKTNVAAHWAETEYEDLVKAKGTKSPTDEDFESIFGYDSDGMNDDFDEGDDSDDTIGADQGSDEDIVMV